MITVDEVITKLEEMLPHVEEKSLYSSRIKNLINKLRSGEYQVSDRLLSTDSLIYDLNAAGFPDIANKLTMKGAIYGL